MADSSFVSLSHSLPSMLFIYLISMPIYICVLASAKEALAISRKRLFSLLLSLDIPSAILLGTESPERVS